MGHQLNTTAEGTVTTELTAFEDFDVKPRGERVLLVDDSRTVRKLFSLYLSARYECVEASSFEEAIAELKASDFAVVITDILMPGMSGIELLRKIITDFPDTAVIVASGVARPQRALDAVRLGAFDYLIKPCEPDVLKVTVERALERRSLVLEARRNKVELETQNAELINRKHQLERLQTQLVQNEKMASLGQLAAGVAHELNNPVGFVYANLEMLGDYVGKLTRLIEAYDKAEIPAGSDLSGIKAEIGYPLIVEEINSIVADCRDGSERIREIVHNLRTFSRLDEAEYKETNVHEGIDSTVRLLSRYFSSGNITLVREYGDLPIIGAFAAPLNQVWMNVLMNAAQALGPEKGEVRIITRADDENVFVEIRDSGRGIAVQHLNRIFDPFYTTKPVGEGTGLGLSISFSIIERHGGQISVTSDLNSGTAFTIRLPRHFEPESLPDEKSIVLYGEM